MPKIVQAASQKTPTAEKITIVVATVAASGKKIVRRSFIDKNMGVLFASRWSRLTLQKFLPSVLDIAYLSLRFGGITSC